MQLSLLQCVIPIIAIDLFSFALLTNNISPKFVTNIVHIHTTTCLRESDDTIALHTAGQMPSRKDESWKQFLLQGPLYSYHRDTGRKRRKLLLRPRGASVSQVARKSSKLHCFISLLSNTRVCSPARTPLVLFRQALDEVLARTERNPLNSSPAQMRQLDLEKKIGCTEEKAEEKTRQLFLIETVHTAYGPVCRRLFHPAQTTFQLIVD